MYEDYVRTSLANHPHCKEDGHTLNVATGWFRLFGNFCTSSRRHYGCSCGPLWEGVPSEGEGVRGQDGRVCVPSLQRAGALRLDRSFK